MSTDSPVRSRAVAGGRFWRNVTLITLAHVALIAMLIRWSSEAQSVPNAQSLVWLSGGDDPATEKSEAGASPPKEASVSANESRAPETDQAEKEQQSLTQAKSEIELQTPQPTVHPVATPKPAGTPPAKAKPTPKTVKKAVLAKRPKSSAYPASNLKKSREEQPGNEKKSTKIARPEAKPSSSNDGGKTESASKGAAAAGGNDPSEFAWYGNMLHDRFYSAWIQPTTSVASGTRISTLVKIRIDKDGRVSKFEIVKPSGNVVVNESVRVVAKQVTQVDPPPAGLIKGEYYDVKINFELNTTR